MTSTCLPPAAYYHINRNTEPVKPRFKEPVDPEIQTALDGLGVWVGTSHEWEAAYRLVFGEKSFEEDYSCIDWVDPLSWSHDAGQFRDAFIMADEFVFNIMHRLFPFQQKELIPALTYVLIASSWSRRSPLPRNIEEHDAITLLNRFSYDNMAEWLKQQH
jgi:hypothetical protein